MVCRNTSWKNQTSVLQWLDKLSLKLVAIDVKTSDAVPTADYINIQVDAAVNIKVGDETAEAPESIPELPEPRQRIYCQGCKRSP